MIRKLHFAEARLVEACTRSRFKENDRLPIGAATAIIVGLNVALWSLIALAVKSILL